MDHSDLAPIVLNDPDGRSLAELFTEYRPRLKQMLQFRIDPRLRSRADLSDILQESYIDASHRLDHYHRKPQMSLYVWLRQITLQRLIDVHRRHLKADKRNVRHEVRLDHQATTSAAIAVQLVDRMVSPSQLAIRHEMINQTEIALEELDEIDREVLALRHFEELTNQEVAQVLKITEAAASVRYVRALTRLRKDLEKIPDFFDGE